MNKTAKIELEYIVKMLTNHIRQPGAWMANSQKLAQSNDEKELKQTILALNVIWTSRHAEGAAIIRLLGGSNVLTPSLTTRGWKFWKQPLIGGQRKKMIEDAFLRWSKDEAAKMEELTKQFEIIPGDMHNMITYLSSVMEIVSTCNRQFVADLKVVMDESNDR